MQTARRTPKKAEADSSPSSPTSRGRVRNENVKQERRDAGHRAGRASPAPTKTGATAGQEIDPTRCAERTAARKQSGVELRRSQMRSAAIREADHRTPKEQGRLETVRHPADPIGYARGKAARRQIGGVPPHSKKRRSRFLTLVPDESGPGSE